MAAAPEPSKNLKIKLEQNVLGHKILPAKKLFECKLPIGTVFVKGKSRVTNNNEWNIDGISSKVIFKKTFKDFKPSLKENKLKLRNLQQTFFPNSEVPYLKTEADSQNAFLANVLLPMEKLFNNYFTVESQITIKNFQADFCLTKTNGEDHILVVIEINQWATFIVGMAEANNSNKEEVTEALDQTIPLISEVVDEADLEVGEKNSRKHGEADHCYKFRLSLKQLHAYLWSLDKNVAFGILSSYCHTYFVILQRGKNDKLTVSPVVKYNDKGVLLKIAEFIQLSITTECLDTPSSFLITEKSDGDKSDDGPDGGGGEEPQTKKPKKDQGDSGDSDSSKSRPTVSGSKTKQAGSGEYIICGIIGEGRCGHVWQVIDCEGRKFAVKSVCHFQDERRFEVASIIHELRNEKQIYRKLKDLQGVVVPRFYFSAYLPGSTYSLFMEELDAKPMRQQDLLREQKEAILDALGQMHGKKILHGDIREANILLDRQNPKQVFFIDFGRSSECDSVADLKREMDELKALLGMV